MKSSILNLLCVLILLAGAGQPLQAGSGSITPAPPNPFGIVGLLNFTINFRSPPTQAQLDMLEEEVNAANDIICDATDGQLVLGQVRVTSGSVNESLADMWIFPQRGRAGLSLFLDGSSLTLEGSHITMFSNSIDGVVIAHELAHLAFGILDEYRERCRFGGPCGIGPCLEPGIQDARNSSLMQQTADPTEFCVASTHDLVRGDNAGCPASSSCTNPGTCENTDLCNGYDFTTNQFELSQQTLGHGDSGWETLVRNMANTYGLTLALPDDLPDPDQPANCGVFLDFRPEVGGTDLVVLTMDRSGSMRTQDVGENTRLEFTQAAARAFIDLQRNAGINLGLVAFNNSATTLREIEPLTFANAGDFQSDVDGLTAGGLTSIGDGLFESLLQIELAGMGQTPANPTIFLLSDGENTAGADPESIAELVIDRGVTVHTIAAGGGADTDFLTDISTATGGLMLPALTDDIIPPTYAEMAARHQGMSMISVIDVQQSTSQIPGVEFGPIIEVNEITFLVEEGADELVIFRSLSGEYTRTVGSGTNTEQVTYDSTRGVFNYLGYFLTPNGFSFIQNASRIMDEGRFYEIITITDPTPGIWTYVVERDASSGAGKFHFRGFIDNGEPDYYIDAYPRTVSTLDTAIRISANVTYNDPLLDPEIQYSGFVVRPDSSIVEITFDRDPVLNSISARFDDLNGRGTYKVFSQVDVPQNAEVLQGEIIFDGPDQDSLPVPNFSRMASTAFFVAIPGCPPCSNDDCDRDGIPNDVEDQFDDLDGDLLPNRCDEDSDGDGFPDEIEGVDDLDNDGDPDAYDADPQGLCESGEQLDISLVSVENPSCGQSDGRIELGTTNARGSVAYTWLHDTSLDSSVAQNLDQASYFVRATDEAGCSATETIQLNADCDQDIVARVHCPDVAVPNCDFPITVTVDMSGSTAPDDTLGSFSAILSWNPSVLRLVGPSSILSDYNGYVNPDSTNGLLIFNGANSGGEGGEIDIFKTYFQPLTTDSSVASVEVEFLAMAAAETFRSLLPDLVVEDCEFSLIGAGLLLGDVNGDSLINSTDANILLTHDAGLPLPSSVFTDRIALGVGDVNGDGNTNSIDALIILTYDARLPVEFALGEEFCPPLGSDYSGRDAKAPSRKVDALWLRGETARGFELPVYVDMQSSSDKLGSYKLELTWNKDALRLVDFRGGPSEAFRHPVFNLEQVEEGKLVLVNAHPIGADGLVQIADLKFERLDAGLSDQLELVLSNMATAGTFTELEPRMEYVVNTAVKEESQAHDLQVFPNPFRDELTISYSLASDVPVDIQVYNVMGQVVSSIRYDRQAAGTHIEKWQPGTSGDLTEGLEMNTGLFVIRAQLGDEILVRKVLFAGN